MSLRQLRHALVVVTAAMLWSSAAPASADSFFNNVPVTSGLLLRLDASNTSSINGGSPTTNDPVATWANSSSGPASNATQGTAGRQPFWVQMVPAINNRSAVDFSGLDDGTGDKLAVSSLNPGSNMTAFVVALYQSQSPSGASSLRPLFGPQTDFPSNGTYSLSLRSQGEGPGFYAYRGNSSITPTTIPAFDNDFHIFVMRSTNALTELFDNSTTVFASGNAASTQNPAETNYFIGGATVNEGRHYDGQMAELLMYSGALTDAQIDQIGGFLAWKYGLETQFSEFTPPVPPLAPEPATLALFGAAACGVGFWHWRRRAIR